MPIYFWIVMAIGLAGTYGSDAVYFFLGRKRGKKWLNRNAHYRNNAELIDHRIDKYPILIFLVYRFMYGFRTIIPMVIGTSRTKTSKFLILSAISTIIWGVAYGALGYLFGEVIKTRLSHIENIEKYIIGILLLLGLVYYLLYRIRNRRVSL